MAFKDDSFYIEEILKGNSNFYAPLVEKHKAMVYTICYKIVRKAEEAEELAQDTFLKAFDKLDKFRGDAKFSTWLYRIAYNAAISMTRKRRLEVHALDDFVISNYSEDEARENLDLVDLEDQQKMLQTVLLTLSDDDYLIINLFYLKELPVNEISSITGLSAANVKVKLHRIRKKLYAEMQAELIKSADV
ncbi:MAG: sigma-70 family RNA polymerase sigma factor [Bacteroidales bacterium]|jgi:RNA polymerase sigma factor (sigma-70 family)|nr:sigma-70 family RNA polymerase sigma factor [Bacteroidales bacterium]